MFLNFIIFSTRIDISQEHFLFFKNANLEEQNHKTDYGAKI